jgi:protoheme IX farnesyltransferase
MSTVTSEAAEPHEHVTRTLPATQLRDVVALAKPRITLFVVITTLGGLVLAQRTTAAGLVAPATQGTSGLPFGTIAWALLGTALVVSGANALNMYWEREIDARMTRTKNRPLPAGRMSPKTALAFGVAWSLLAVPVLGFGVNLLTAFLAVLANLLYVFAYTPLKQRSHLSLLVGAVPGAIPPLLGWTALTGRIDAAGLVLFSILFLWQVPHFLAITLFRRDEYKAAGLVVMPNVAPEPTVRRAMVHFSLALFLVSLLLVPLGVAHVGYLAITGGAGLAFLGFCMWGLRPSAGLRWARSVFAASLVYIVLAMAALGVGV